MMMRATAAGGRWTYPLGGGGAVCRRRADRSDEGNLAQWSPAPPGG